MKKDELNSSDLTEEKKEKIKLPFMLLKGFVFISNIKQYFFIPLESIRLKTINAYYMYVSGQYVAMKTKERKNSERTHEITKLLSIFPLVFKTTVSHIKQSSKSCILTKIIPFGPRI